MSTLCRYISFRTFFYFSFFFIDLKVTDNVRSFFSGKICCYYFRIFFFGKFIIIFTCIRSIGYYCSFITFFFWLIFQTVKTVFHKIRIAVCILFNLIIRYYCTVFVNCFLRIRWISYIFYTVFTTVCCVRIGRILQYMRIHFSIFFGFQPPVIIFLDGLLCNTS